MLVLFEHSLSLTLMAIFIVSLWLHATTGARQFSEHELAHGRAAVSAVAYIGTSSFWFESFQNWQSEFLALLAVVALSVFLRQRGSPESKPVSTPTWETG